jgi:DNA polymerase/3'-5' exonuclease PolX
MKRDQGMPLEYAREMADALVELLAPACERIAIAGSVRRKKKFPNDIEVVCEPKLTDRGRNLCDLACEDLLRTGQLEKRPDSRGRHCWGTGIKRAVFFRGQDYAPVDLFQVIEPRQWGVIYAIRTGPGDFNRVLVTSQWFGGACPKGRKVAGGRVWDFSGCTVAAQQQFARMPAHRFARLAEKGDVPAKVVPTPTEESFFEAMEVPCWSPEERTEKHIQAYLRQTRR